MRKIIFALLLICFAACKTQKKTADHTAAQQDSTVSLESENWAQLKYAAGTIIKSDGIAGCSFVVKLEDHRVLEPLNLADSLKKNNLKLWLRFHSSGNQTGICMMGEIVTIDDVQYRK